MAVTVKREYVLNKVEAEKLPYFTITDGKSVIAQNQESDDYKQSLNEITEAFDSIDDAYVILKVSDKTNAQRAKGGKDHIYYEFKVNLRNAAIGGASGGLSVKDAEGYLREIHALQLKLQQKETEMKFAEYDRKLLELKEGKTDYMPQIINAISGVIGAKGQSVGMAGVNDETISEEAVNKVDQQQVLKTALIRLSKIDKSLPDTLTKLAAWAEKHPTQYQLYMNALEE